MGARGRAGSILTAAMLVMGGGDLRAQECRLENGPERSVARVLDGETLLLDDGSEVRLIGALAPRAADIGATEGGWEQEDRARTALEALVQSMPVVLGFGGERRDRNGRLLAQVFAGREGARTWVQGAMLAGGHARAYAIGGNRACAAALLAQEAKARDARLGLWRQAAYAVRDAVPPRGLDGLAATFQVVEGRIGSVGGGRDGVRLTLGRDRRRDLTVTIRTGDRALLGALGGDLKALEGRRVEARGWLEPRSGMFARFEIDVSTAGMIRLIDAGDAMAPDGGSQPRSPRGSRRQGAAPGGSEDRAPPERQRPAPREPGVQDIVTP